MTCSLCCAATSTTSWEIPCLYGSTSCIEIDLSWVSSAAFYILYIFRSIESSRSVSCFALHLRADGAVAGGRRSRLTSAPDKFQLSHKLKKRNLCAVLGSYAPIYKKGNNKSFFSFHYWPNSGSRNCRIDYISKVKK